MAGRGRLLLGPDFVHDEVELSTPPVVGRVIEWPLPRTEYRSYPSDADLHTSPSLSNDPGPEPGTSTSSTSPDDQQTRGVKQPSTVRFSKVKYNRVVFSPLPSSSHDDDEPSPVPISKNRTRPVMAVIPSVRPRVPRPVSPTIQTPEQQPAAPAGPTAPQQPNTRPTPENNPALALERLNLLQQYIIDQEELKQRYFSDLRNLNRRYGDDR
ncbi:hypothetical protein DAPPUDRAFT_328750 [Daphnia pulex]|uniref:Uncharacterized protein n=1 Tax=Daphnia pulex TaxID=6669 RepID=E9HEN8_DAPPU|nr:hypothetical protein DAPPUDRAFT_328750 [Daphnia pulex]|eukprot:EFX69812.1 hypothetical protein DAPPUDRAFT_328750 [Daphnia pulex]